MGHPDLFKALTNLSTFGCPINSFMNTVQLNALRLIFLLFITVTHLSCKKENSAPVKEKVNKMVLVYMEANNDLRYDAINSINSMEKGAANLDGVLLVYIKTSSTRSYLLKIKYDSNEDRIVSDTIKTFQNTSPSDAEFMKDVINYAQAEYPANSYGLILWSHATSWAPPGANTITTKSFGRDTGKETDIIELKNALPGNFEFIIFDACAMGGVEVLYEFKDKAKYIIASPAETLAESFPYQQITPMLFSGTADYLKSVAETYYNYYNAYADDRQSATVVLVNTAELVPLANQMKSLITKTKVYGDTFTRTGIQRLDFTSGFPVANYDFGDFLAHNFNNSQLADLLTQLSQTIIYKQATARFLGVPIRTFSGLTSYIPYQGDVNLSYYKKLGWYKSSGVNTLFEK